MSTYTRIMALGAVFSAFLVVLVWAAPGAAEEPVVVSETVEVAGPVAVTGSAEAEATAGPQRTPVNLLYRISARSPEIG